MRGRRNVTAVLAVLASAGEPVPAAAVLASGQGLARTTAYSALRAAVAHGLAVRRPAGTFRVAWEITPAGRQFLLAEAERDAAASRASAAAARRNRLIRLERRRGVPATPEQRRAVSVRLRYAGCSYAQIASVTGVSRQQAWNDCNAAGPAWPGPPVLRKRRPAPARIEPGSPAFSRAAWWMADETGLDYAQGAGVLRVMLAAGLTITVPADWRGWEAETRIADAVASGTEDELPPVLAEMLAELEQEEAGSGPGET